LSVFGQLPIVQPSRTVNSLETAAYASASGKPRITNAERQSSWLTLYGIGLLSCPVVCEVRMFAPAGRTYESMKEHILADV